ncbi:hypothetical protein DFJ74DRAFT_680942 [Hyaloraphidium curvatum]|nr:hypothetical protein DFJ74DRAFT_680942 [Hyaloraphidium curvatum]
MSATTQVAEAVPGLATPRAPQTPLRDREARLEAQRQVIETQFDLEIFLKRCELNTINEEIKRGEDLLERLKDAILNGPPPAGTFAPDIVPRLATLSTPTLPEVPMPLPLPQEHPALPPIMTEPFPILETPTMAAPTPRSVKPTPNALTASATPAPTVPDPVARNPTPPSPVLPAPMPLPLSPTSPRGKRRASARKLTGMDGSLYARRSDGVLVKIACPICDRSDFQNLQGFVNHTRISHNKSFASHDVAVRECGIELAEDGTPLNRPTGTPPLTEDEPSAPRTRPGQKAKKVGTLPANSFRFPDGRLPTAPPQR